MSRTIAYCLAGALVAAAAPAAAQSPFDGTWKVNPSAMKITTAKPDEYWIKGGSFTCQTCQPNAYTVKADGQFHAVKGRPYWDEVAIAVVDPATVSYKFRKGGKVISETTSKVSADGNSVSSTTHNTNNGAGTPIDTTATLTRAGPAPAGAHAISGKWTPAPPTSVSDAALTLTIKVAGDTLTTTSPMGETLTAKIGGPYAPNVGDPGKTMTKVEKAGANAYRFTDMRGGKVVGTSTYTLGADGRTITGEWQDTGSGNAGSWTATKI